MYWFYVDWIWYRESFDDDDDDNDDDDEKLFSFIEILLSCQLEVRKSFFFISFFSQQLPMLKKQLKQFSTITKQWKKFFFEKKIK